MRPRTRFAQSCVAALDGRSYASAPYACVRKDGWPQADRRAILRPLFPGIMVRPVVVLLASFQ